MKYFLILSFIIITACSPEDRTADTDQRSETPEESSDEIMRIIDEKNNEIEQLYREGRIEEAASHFAANLIQMPPNQPIINGRDEYISRWNESAAMGTWEFDLRVQEVKSSGNLAVERGTYTLGFTPNENSPIPAMMDEGNYLVLWEKTDGEWKILWDAPVSSVPLPMPEN